MLTFHNACTMDNTPPVALLLHVMYLQLNCVTQIYSVYIYTAAPVITTKQSLISALDVVIGAPLTLTCTSSGSPPEIFIWMKDGVGINSTSITSIIAVNYTNTSAIFSTSYTISNLSTSDNGTYTCTVSNLIGNDCHAIAVHVCKYLCKYIIVL